MTRQTPAWVEPLFRSVDDRDAAQRLASRIVGQRLASCVQCVPVQSTYRWKGAVESEAEFLLLAKTRAALAERVTAFIRDTHPYELPEVTVSPIIGGLPAYLEWVRSETADD